jgi:hypothetical protein
MTASAQGPRPPAPHASGSPDRTAPHGATPPTAPQQPALTLVVVRTPQPPLADPLGPLRLVLPGVPVPRPIHHPGPRPRPDRPGGVDPDFGPALSGRAELPDAARTGRRVLTLTLEALCGRRPLAQLQRLTSPGVWSALGTGRRPGWCVRSTSPLVLGPVHVCEPVDGVAEITAVAHRDGRAHAVAARLEGLDGRWRCTALQVG